MELRSETISADTVYWFDHHKEWVCDWLLLHVCFFFVSSFSFFLLHPYHIFTSSSDTSPFSLLSPYCLSSPVWYYRRRRPQWGFDGAQPAGRPAALPDERRGPARVCGSAGHAGRCSLLQPGRRYCSGHGHPLPCYVHQHRFVKEQNYDLFLNTSHIESTNFNSNISPKRRDEVEEVYFNLPVYKILRFLLVLLVQSEYGTILKALATPNKNLQGCYLEEMELLPPGVREPVLSLQILHSDRSLFVGLNNRVLKIPLERCSTYKTETWVLHTISTSGGEFDLGRSYK